MKLLQMLTIRFLFLFPINSKANEANSWLKKEIDVILSKLESQNANLGNSLNEYQRLIQLNKHIDSLFKKKLKEITSKKELKKND